MYTPRTKREAELMKRCEEFDFPDNFEFVGSMGYRVYLTVVNSYVHHYTDDIMLDIRKEWVQEVSKDPLVEYETMSLKQFKMRYVRK